MSALINTKYLDCIEACQACLIDCKVCLSKMATMESKNDCPYCCVQAIDVLQATIGLMAADSKFAVEHCQLCAKVCEYCAKHCAEHDEDWCQRCAESCRKCVEECRKLAA
ncbi:hypothetical protein GGR26_001852 [Lewinella marina]|uniref:Four-helix bundle copper-binding protein n=1 Tax=Neolewinella marina TaxID=438751 RepID=A0A2G0CHK2_9BACT|nr:four-helix bundle copper-binding protein [Neolewinella marina]NJB86084.1 hypothetical protein [Neolewinella marina]PHK99438.1 four-helix bundle copper-binding protein [Neolewinella marina]